jgi:hypothetical protein
MVAAQGRVLARVKVLFKIVLIVAVTVIKMWSKIVKNFQRFVCIITTRSVRIREITKPTASRTFILVKLASGTILRRTVIFCKLLYAHHR